MSARKNTLFLAVALLAVFGFTSLIALTVFDSHPFTMDEYSMLFQSRLFAKGELAQKAEPYSGLLQELYILEANGRIFSKYPPATAAFHALGILAGMPALVNPLLSTLSALFIFLTLQKIFSNKTAWLVLGILGTSPYFYPYAASFHSAPLSLFLVSLGFYLFTRQMAAPRIVKSALMGGCVGLLFLARQLDALCLGVVLGTALLMQSGAHHRRQQLLAFGAAALAGIAALLTYNRLQTGIISLSTFPVWSDHFVVVIPGNSGFLDNLQRVAAQYWDSFLRHTARFLLPQLVVYIGVGAFSLFTIGCVLPLRRFKAPLLLFILMMVGLYSFHDSAGYPLYGSRYWYPALGAFLLIAGNTMHWLQGVVNRKVLLLSYGILILLQLGSLTFKLAEYEQRFDLVLAVQRDIQSTCPEKSIVQMEKPSKLEVRDIRYFSLPDFKRNPPLESRLIVLFPHEALQLQTYFPDYRICPYNFRDGELSSKLPGFPASRQFPQFRWPEAISG